MATLLSLNIHQWRFVASVRSWFHLHNLYSLILKQIWFQVLLMTLQNAPPGLDYERDRKFSRVYSWCQSILYILLWFVGSFIISIFASFPQSFKQMIASCLVKDPSKRPSAKKLLKHSFFKQARSSDYIARKLLDGLPDLVNRVQAIKVRYVELSSYSISVQFYQSASCDDNRWGNAFMYAEKGRRYACTRENGRWREGGTLPGLCFHSKIFGSLYSCLNLELLVYSSNCYAEYLAFNLLS